MITVKMSKILKLEDLSTKQCIEPFVYNLLFADFTDALSHLVFGNGQRFQRMEHLPGDVASSLKEASRPTVTSQRGLTRKISVCFSNTL